jgi:hypothetical protein
VRDDLPHLWADHGRASTFVIPLIFDVREGGVEFAGVPLFRLQELFEVIL